MNTDIQTKAFLHEHGELNPATQDTAQALARWFASADLRVRLVEDPETGNPRLRFEVITGESGASARQKLRDFVREELPASARLVESMFSFTVVRA